MASVLPQALPSVPDGAMKRVIVHWTGGGPEPNDLDREHYHVMVSQSLAVTLGEHSVAANVRTDDGDYAAHTLHCNQGSVGVALCGMLNATEYPFRPGPYPITEPQWDLAAKVVAEVCDRYGISVTTRTVLQHGEVEEILGIEQRAKWDCCRLPWVPDWTHRQCGDDFRRRVQRHLDASEDGPIPIEALVMGIGTAGLLMDSQAVVAIRPLIAAGVFGPMELMHPHGPHDVEVMIPVAKDRSMPPLTLPFYNVKGTGFVPARKLADALGMKVAYDAQLRRVTIGP
jgi:hypothetical protein